MASTFRSVIFSVATLSLIFAIGCAPSGGFKITPVPADQTLQEKVVYPCTGWVSDRIAIIEVSGVLMNAHSSSLFGSGEHPVSFIVEKLAAAAKDNRVKAVVLRINSPGGSVTASDSMYQEILAFKKKTGKPVIAYFQDVAASGAYYLACAADEIIAQRTSVTGSIGVIMQMVNFTETMNKLGISADAITSGPYKDAGSPLRPMKPNERELFQGLVDNFYQQFVSVVATGRPKLTRDQVLKLADGRVYSSQQALENGLVDRIGTLTEAIDIAKSKAGIKSAQTVVYIRPLDWKPNIYASSPATPATQNISLFNINLPEIWTTTPIFLYIWHLD